MSSDLVPVRRALISVYDKTGLAEFAKALHEEFKVELISTGGTARFLREQGLLVTDVADVTGFPEMMDGRVKTLHPKIHGGLLAIRDNPAHAASMKEHGIAAIDLVCINLYPFQQTIAKRGVTFEEAIEQIDIGGPSMVRSAAKNHRYVLVVTSPERYQKVLGDLREHQGSSCGKHRLKQAQRAFLQTSRYDEAIARYLQAAVTPKADAAPTVPQTATQADAGPRWVDRLVQAMGSSRDEFLNALTNAMAVSVGGTEAAAFIIARSADAPPTLGPVVHLRPDGSDAATRAAALKAFQDIVAPCVRENKDGAIEIGSPDGGDPQFCIVTQLRSGGTVAAAIAVIVRAADLVEARKALRAIQPLAGYFELFSMRRAEAATATTTLARDPSLPPAYRVDVHKKQELRYGENPHQKAALYVGEQPAEASVAFAEQLHGKELSYINLLDADAALSAVKELAAPAACIVKHATPCGYASGPDIATAFRRAFEGDPLAAFGGIVALNKPVDLACATAITSIDKLLEVIVAPSYAPDALALLKDRWKNVRLLAVGDVHTLDQADKNELMLHKIVGGYLVQERDLAGLPELKVVSKRQPTPQELVDLQLAWLACKHVKSNAIVLAKNGQVVGVGGGQVDRVNAARIAIQKAGDRAKGAVAASDAFFPFPDGPELLLNAGVTAIVHPGGSVRDADTQALVDQRGAALVLTGRRHFRH